MGIFKFEDYFSTLLYHCLLVTCGMMVSLDLRSCSPIVLIFIPSMLISPPAASMIRNKDNVMDDFPAPVLPTIPI